MLADEIICGLVHTTDDRYVKILEIEPINYTTMSNKRKNVISSSFERMLQAAPSSFQMQVVSYRADISDHINNLKRKRASETDKNVIEQADRHIEHVSSVSSAVAKERHYYFSYEYEGDPETQKKSHDIDEIYQSMKSMEFYLRSEFMKLGNRVVEYRPEEENIETCRILYNFYNRKSSADEILESRMLRISDDQNKVLGKTKADVRSYIAPKGITKITPDTILMDGLYYTYLCIKGDSHPSSACCGWIDNYLDDDGVDVSIYATRLDPYRTTQKLGRVSRFKEVRANDKAGNAAAQEELYTQKDAAEYMRRKIKEGQGIYDVMIMFTVCADSLKTLKSKKANLIKNLKRDQLAVESSYLWAIEAMQMSSPLNHIDSRVFSRNSHNYLTESLSTLYPYNGCNLYNPNGWFLGLNNNGSLLVLDNFDTSMFPNANMAIFGTSGAGKTFTELVIGNHTRLNGIRTIYLYPEKAEEAQKACAAIGGSYIQLDPFSSDCINLMEIRPPKILPDDERESFEFKTISLLGKKTIDIKVFTELLMVYDHMTVEEDALLDIAIANTYGRFGITSDNSTLYVNGLGSELKEMPIIEDLYRETLKEPKLSRISTLYTTFITGTSKSLNAKTNVDTENNYIVIACDKKAIGEKLLSAYLYLAFSLIKDLMKESRLKNDICFLDEGWRFLENELSAKQVEELFTLIRGYGGSAVFATQQLGKTINGKNAEYGKSIINNAEIKLFLRMKEKELEALDELIGLTEEDKNLIMGFDRGYGLLVYGGSRIVVQVVPSETELMNFTTDTKTLRMLRELEKKREIS